MVKGKVILSIFYKFLLAACLGFLAFPQEADAQKVRDLTPPGQTLGRDYTLAERFSYRTNALEWLLTIPNIGMEFDLFKSQYNRQTIGLTAKYNWNTYHKYAPATVFNMMDIRPEYRYYFRNVQRTKKASDGKKQKFGDWFMDNVWTLERKNPKEWRAYYIGAYVDYGSYAFKFGKTGIQGQTVGFGGTWGYDVPRYQYEKCSIDVEFGFSLGLQVTQYNAFTHNPDGYFYEPLPEKSRNWHLTPFPVISELKVAFVLRPVSIQNKYVKDDPLIKVFQNAKDDVRSYFLADGSITKARFDETYAEELPEYQANKSKYLKAFKEYVDKEAKEAEESALALVKDEGVKNHIHSYVKGQKAQAINKFRFQLAKVKAPETPAAKTAKPAKAENAAKAEKPVKEKKPLNLNIFKKKDKETKDE